jgi:hypothetical protein
MLIRSRPMGAAAVKGAVIRSQLNGLDQLGLRAAVVQALPPRTRALVDSPPSLVEWVAIAHSFDIAKAVGALGADTVERFGRVGSERLLATSFRPVIQGIFSVFGSDPHTLLSRGDLVVRAGFRDVQFAYRKVSERSCECEVSVDGENVPLDYWRVWKATLVHTYSLCKREGTVQLIAPTEPSRARFAFEWA